MRTDERDGWRALAVAATLLAALAAFPQPAAAKDARRVRVVCTLPAIGAIAREVGGDRVEVTVLARPDQDPHYVVPTPGLMATARDADLYCEVGLSLELWSGRVLDGARNPRIRVGQTGHVFVSTGVPREQVPLVVSRAQGDLHPQGNPHLWLDPLNGKRIAKNLAEGLQRVDPAGAAGYQKRLADFEARLGDAYYGPELVKLLGSKLLDRLRRSGRLFAFLKTKRFRKAPLSDRLGGWLGRMWPLRDQPFVSYHRAWVYFAKAFGLRSVGQLEAKPGIPPTPGHLAQLAARAREAKVRIVWSAPYYNVRKTRSFAERLHTTAVVLPAQPGFEGTESYFDLFELLTRRLAETYGPKPSGKRKGGS